MPAVHRVRRVCLHPLTALLVIAAGTVATCQVIQPPRTAPRAPVSAGSPSGVNQPPRPRGPEAVPPGAVALPGQTLRIPVLTYHFIRVNPDPRDRVGFDLSVTPADLEAQISELQRGGVHTLTPDEFFDIIHTGREPAEKVVLLTFDDGFDNFATQAAPILQRHGMTAIDFVVSGFVGKPQYMTADQVRGVEKLGMHVGAHSVHHVPLAREPRDRMVGEVTESKSALENLLGHHLLDFAYPYGSFDPIVEAAVKSAGFRCAVTTVKGTDQPLSDPFALRRVEVLGGEQLSAFDRTVGIQPQPAVAPGAPAPAVIPPAAIQPNLTAVAGEPEHRRLRSQSPW